MRADAERRLSMALMIIGIIVVTVSACMIFYEFTSLNAKYANDRHADPAGDDGGAVALDEAVRKADAVDEGAAADVSPGKADEEVAVCVAGPWASPLPMAGASYPNGGSIGDAQPEGGAVALDEAVVRKTDAADEGAAADVSLGKADGEVAGSSGCEPVRPEFNAMTGVLEGGEQRSILAARTESPVNVSVPVSVSNPVTINVPESLLSAGWFAFPLPYIYTNATTANTCNHDWCGLTARGYCDAPMADRAIILKDVTINVSPVIIFQMDGGRDEAPAPKDEEAALPGTEQPEAAAQPGSEVGTAGELRHGLTFTFGAGLAVKDYGEHGSWHGYDPLTPVLSVGYFTQFALRPRVSIGLDAYGVYSPHLYSANTSNVFGTASGGTHWNQMSLDALNHIIGAGARANAILAVGGGCGVSVFVGVETSVPVRKTHDDPGRRVNTGTYTFVGGIGFDVRLGKSMELGIESMYMHTIGYRGSAGVRIRMHYLMSGI